VVSVSVHAAPPPGLPKAAAAGEGAGAEAPAAAAEGGPDGEAGSHAEVCAAVVQPAQPQPPVPEHAPLPAALGQLPAPQQGGPPAPVTAEHGSAPAGPLQAVAAA
jgi:hypothetical protein